MSSSLYYVITYIALEIFSVYTFYRLMRIFLGDDIYYGKHIEFLSYFFYFLINLILYFTVKIPIVLLSTSIFLLFLVTINYSTLSRIKIFAVLFINMLLVCIDTIIALFTSYEYLSPFTRGAYFPLISNIIAKLTLYFFMLFLKKLSGIKSKFQMPKAYWISLIIIPLSTIYMVIILPIMSLSLTQVLLCVLIIFSVNFVLIYLYDLLALQASHNTKQLLLEQELNSFQQQLENMKANLNHWDKMRHDFKSHIILLEAFLGDDINSETKDYLENNFKKFFIEDQVNTGVIIIDSIMNYQIYEASLYQIKVKPEVFIPYELELENIDAISILSYMFTYAIESVRNLKLECKTINVNIKFSYSRHRLIFTFNIPYNSPNKLSDFCPPDTFEISIKKYNGFWKINDENNVREIMLIIYLNEQNFPSINDDNINT